MEQRKRGKKGKKGKEKINSFVYIPFIYKLSIAMVSKTCMHVTSLKQISLAAESTTFPWNQHTTKSPPKPKLKFLG